MLAAGNSSSSYMYKSKLKVAALQQQGQAVYVPVSAGQGRIHRFDLAPLALWLFDVFLSTVRFVRLALPASAAAAVLSHTRTHAEVDTVSQLMFQPVQRSCDAGQLERLG